MKCKMCELLKRVPIKDIHHEDKQILVIPNIKSGVYKEKLLFIWKEHKKELSAEELKWMYIK